MLIACSLIEKDAFSKAGAGQLPPRLSQYFRIPDYLFSDMYRRSNGFFTFESSYSKDGQLRSYSKYKYGVEAKVVLTLHLDTWFRFVIKLGNHSRPNSTSYTWHEMTFFSSWSPDRCSMLCVGTPHLFLDLLRATLSRMWPNILSLDPYSLHIPLVESIIAMQDSSIWFVRDIIRNVEKVRPIASVEYAHEANTSSCRIGLSQHTTALTL